MMCTAGNMFCSHNKRAHGHMEVFAFAMIDVQDFSLY